MTMAYALPMEYCKLISAAFVAVFICWTFLCVGPLFVPRDVLNHWREKNHQWLELSEVHCETTQGVRVTVMPFYMGWRQTGGGAGGQDKIHCWR